MYQLIFIMQMKISEKINGYLILDDKASPRLSSRPRQKTIFPEKKFFFLANLPIFIMLLSVSLC